MENLKYTIISNEYDDENGIAKLTIDSPLGTFSSQAKCTEQSGMESKNLGFTLCEYKCRMKLWKAKKKMYQERMKEDLAIINDTPLGEPGGKRDLLWKHYANNMEREAYCGKMYKEMKDGYLHFSSNLLSSRTDFLNRMERLEKEKAKEQEQED